MSEPQKPAPPLNLWFRNGATVRPSLLGGLVIEGIDDEGRAFSVTLDRYECWDLIEAAAEVSPYYPESAASVEAEESPPTRVAPPPDEPVRTDLHVQHPSGVTKPRKKAGRKPFGDEETLRRMAALTAEGMTPTQIAGVLTGEGRKSPTGKGFTAKLVWYYLSSRR